MSELVSRRELLGTAAAGVAASALQSAPVRAQGPARGANERLVVALIGCGGMGRGNMNSVISHGGRIAAVCDVDSNHMAQAAADAARQQGTSPEQIKDFRKVMERKDI